MELPENIERLLALVREAPGEDADADESVPQTAPEARNEPDPVPEPLAEPEPPVDLPEQPAPPAPIPPEPEPLPEPNPPASERIFDPQAFDAGGDATDPEAVDEESIDGIDPDMRGAPDRGPGQWSMNASEFFSQLTAHLYRVNEAVLEVERGSATRVSLDVRFIMQRDGRVLGVRVLRSSGDPEIDRAAESIVIAASPLPQLSDDMPQDRLELIAPVEVYR